MLHGGWSELLAGLSRLMAGRKLSIGSNGNMASFKDLESVLAGGILDGDGLASQIDVAVLAKSLAVLARLLPEDDSILLSVSRPKPSISRVEPLFLQDLGRGGVHIGSIGQNSRWQAN